MSPELARLHVTIEREKRATRARDEWAEHQAAIDRQERQNSARHKPTQGQGRGLYNVNFE